MKVAVALIVCLLGAGVASAQPADPYNAPPPPVAAVPQQPPPVQQARPRALLRQMLLARFDRNHDGRLEPRERRAAARALRRLARRLMQRRGPRARRRLRGVIQRYDLNRDGNVGPGEMPPAMARRLRPLDRNGDGWVDDGDFSPNSP